MLHFFLCQIELLEVTKAAELWSSCCSLTWLPPPGCPLFAQSFSSTQSAGRLQRAVTTSNQWSGVIKQVTSAANEEAGIFLAGLFTVWPLALYWWHPIMSSLRWLVALWKDLGAKSQKNQRNIINVLTCHSVKSLTEKNSGSLTAVWLFSLILICYWSPKTWSLG